MLRASSPWLLASLLLGCPSLRVAPSEDGGAAAPDAATEEPTEDGGATDATPKKDAGPKPLGSYDDEQSALEAKRFPGPLTAQGSRGFCTPKYFVWRDSDGALHSWSGESKARIDYTFKASARAYYGPSETFIPVDTPTFDTIAVYRTTEASALVTNIDYAFHFLASKDGIVRLDQRINNVDLNGTKVRHWKPIGTTEDISEVLPTKQPPSSYANDEVVIPGDVNVPYPLYIVNIAKKTTTSVTFDGSIGIRQTVPSPHGLFVSYARSGPTSALRLYRNNQNAAASRFELGDELANRPPLFTDTPASEHTLLARIDVFGNSVIYDSAFGLWAYDMISASLVPIQLAVDKKAFLVDTMCVLRDPGLLVYRLLGDTVGQVWAVPLASVLP